MGKQGTQLFYAKHFPIPLPPPPPPPPPPPQFSPPPSRARFFFTTSRGTKKTKAPPCTLTLLFLFFYFLTDRRQFDVFLRKNERPGHIKTEHHVGERFLAVGCCCCCIGEMDLSRRDGHFQGQRPPYYFFCMHTHTIEKRKIMRTQGFPPTNALGG